MVYFWQPLAGIYHPLSHYSGQEHSRTWFIAARTGILKNGSMKTFKNITNVDYIYYQFGGFLRARFPLTIWKKLSIKQMDSLPVNQLSQVSTASAVSKIP